MKTRLFLGFLVITVLLGLLCCDINGAAEEEKDGDSGEKVGQWIDLGYASTEGAQDISIAMGTDNKPVVVFTDNYNYDKVHVFKYEP
jgi:hypothetical protein